MYNFYSRGKFIIGMSVSYILELADTVIDQNYKHGITPNLFGRVSI